MCDLGTIVPKNVFLLITRERVFINKITEQNGPLELKWNQLFRVPIHERNRLVLYLWFKIKLYQKCVNPLSLFEEHLFLLVSCKQALSFRFTTRGTFVLHCVFSQCFAFIAHFLVFSQPFLRNNCSLFSCYFLID